jgi:hypothetical protein
MSFVSHFTSNLGFGKLLNPNLKNLTVHTIDKLSIICSDTKYYVPKEQVMTEYKVGDVIEIVESENGCVGCIFILIAMFME